MAQKIIFGFGAEAVVLPRRTIFFLRRTDLGDRGCVLSSRSRPIARSRHHRLDQIALPCPACETGYAGARRDLAPPLSLRSSLLAGHLLFTTCLFWPGNKVFSRSFAVITGWRSEEVAWNGRQEQTD